MISYHHITSKIVFKILYIILCSKSLFYRPYYSVFYEPMKRPTKLVTKKYICYQYSKRKILFSENSHFCEKYNDLLTWLSICWSGFFSNLLHITYPGEVSNILILISIRQGRGTDNRAHGVKFGKIDSMNIFYCLHVFQYFHNTLNNESPHYYQT